MLGTGTVCIHRCIHEYTYTFICICTPTYIRTYVRTSACAHAPTYIQHTYVVRDPAELPTGSFHVGQVLIGSRVGPSIAREAAIVNRHAGQSERDVSVHASSKGQHLPEGSVCAPPDLVDRESVFEEALSG